MYSEVRQRRQGEKKWPCASAILSGGILCVLNDGICLVDAVWTYFYVAISRHLIRIHRISGISEAVVDEPFRAVIRLSHSIIFKH